MNGAVAVFVAFVAFVAVLPGPRSLVPAARVAGQQELDHRHHALAEPGAAFEQLREGVLPNAQPQGLAAKVLFVEGARDGAVVGLERPGDIRGGEVQAAQGDLEIVAADHEARFLWGLQTTRRGG